MPNACLFQKTKKIQTGIIITKGDIYYVNQQNVREQYGRLQSRQRLFRAPAAAQAVGERRKFPDSRRIRRLGLWQDAGDVFVSAEAGSERDLDAAFRTRQYDNALLGKLRTYDLPELA